MAAALLCVALGTFQMLRAPASAQGPGAADLILSNGKIVTVDERFTIAQAVAIRGDRIVAVGTNQDIARLAGPNTRRIDLRGPDGRSRADRQPHAPAARRATPGSWSSASTASSRASRRSRCCAPGRRRPAPGGWVFNIGGWATAQFADDRQAVHARGTGSDRAGQSGRAAGVVLPGLPEQPRRWRRSASRRARPTPTTSSRDRSCATRPASRPASSGATSPRPVRLPRDCPKVAPDQLEASSLALVKDMNRAGLTSFGVAGCNADVLEIFQKWKAQGRLNVRVFCIGGASAGTPGAGGTIDPADRRR